MKKEWTDPEITCLDVEDTNNGSPSGSGDMYAVTGTPIDTGFFS